MTGSYDLTLVLLSIVVAASASYVALDLAVRVAASRGRAALYWLASGGTVMGLGVWAMHFIGMLAYELPIPIAYDLGITAISLAFPVAFSVMAIWLVSRPKLSREHWLAGSFIMGMGIVAMHYTGMAAMRMQPAIRYEPSLLATSMLIAVAASLAALWLCFTLRRSHGRRATLQRSLAAMVMAFAITGMHYTGMAAARFAPDSQCLAVDILSLDNDVLAFSIAIVVLLIIVATLALSMFDSAAGERIRSLARDLQATNARLRDEAAAREALTAKLAQSNKELEHFAYVASHDLRAPLRTVTGFSSLLRRRYSDVLGEEGNELLDLILEGTVSMEALIDGLLDLSRVNSDVQQIWFDLDAAASEALKRLASTVEERGAQVSKDDLPQLHGDPRLLTQLLQNLVANGIKFQPGDAPRVQISAQRSNDGGLALAVRDEGIGIAPEHINAIFDIFRRLHTAEEFEGTGIGLSVVRKIADLHEGSISVESTPGAGSTFTLHLPASRVLWPQESVAAA